MQVGIEILKFDLRYASIWSTLLWGGGPGTYESLQIVEKESDTEIYRVYHSLKDNRLSDSIDVHVKLHQSLFRVSEVSTSLAGYCAYQYANSDALTDNIRRPFQPILDKPQKSVSGIRVFQSSRKLWSPISSDASYVTLEATPIRFGLTVE
ncbi:hypothetical protein M433DRAFT_136836 [Acidomyces richmondensis BFW]|nr:hypothetical protein M433DRAFT_136836 [Acidomyces richmondensis BFW]